MIQPRNTAATAGELASPESSGAYWALLLLAAAAVVLPAFIPGYYLSTVILFVISAITMMGYRTITTMGGWSFAHAALMGLGAYTAALLMTNLQWPFWIMLVLSPLVAGLFALAIAVPVLRTRSFYFFLSTFAAGEALRQSFIQFSGLTGGNNGVPFIPRPGDLFGWSFEANLTFYYLAVVVAAVVMIGLHRLYRSDFGKSMQLVAQNEELSRSLGINTLGYRVAAFVIGSAVAGLAGCLLASFNGVIGPSDFGTHTMFKIIAAAIIGGVSTLWGPIIGLLFLTLVEESFRGIPQWVPLLWGVGVIVTLLFLPRGLESLVLGRKTKGGRHG